MIPQHHPPTTGKADYEDMRNHALWCPTWYPVVSENLERWLLDQVSLSVMPPLVKWQILEQMSPVLLAVRAAIVGGMPLHQVLDENVPKGNEWRAFEINGTFNIWKCGKNSWAIQIRKEPDGSVRWQAGHSFRPFVSCSHKTQKSKSGPGRDFCGETSAILIPVCLKHVDRPFRDLLASEGLVDAVLAAKESGGEPAADALASPAPEPCQPCPPQEPAPTGTPQEMDLFSFAEKKT